MNNCPPKKALAWVLTFTTIAWSIGLGSFLALPIVAQAAAGDLVKSASASTVYLIGTDGTTIRPFPHSNVFKSWGYSFANVKTVDISSYTVGSNVEFRDGSLVRDLAADKTAVYVVSEKKLRPVKSADIFTGLGYKWNKITWLTTSFLNEYTTGVLVDSSAAHPNGNLVKYATSSAVYLIADAKTRAFKSGSVFTGNRYSWGDVITIPASETYTAGTVVEAAETALSTPSGVTAPVTPTTGLTVALASDSPLGKIIADGTAYNNFLKLNLTAGTTGEVKVTGIKVTRGGVSTNTQVSGVLVVDKDGKQYGSTVTSLAADNTASINFADAPITIPAGGSAPVTIQVHIPGTAGTASMKFSLASAADITTTATVSGTFPISGSEMSITDGGSTVGALTVDAVQVHDNGATDTTAVSVNLATLDKELTRFRLTAGANEDIKVSKITIYNNGNTVDADLANIDLVAPTGDVLATVAKTTSKLAVFDLSSSPYTIAKGTSKDLTLRLDIVSGSTRTVRFIIQNDYDVVTKGASTASGILATANASGTDQSFPIGDQATGGNYMNKLTIGSGSLSIKKDLNSPSGQIAVGAQDAVLAKFELEAVGEDIEWRKVTPKVTIPNATYELIGTFKLVDSTGATLWSIDATNDNLYSTGTPAAQTLATYKTIKAGAKETISAIGSVSSSATTAYTYQVSLKDFYVVRKNTNDYVTYQTTYVDANTLSVSTANLSVTKNQAFANPTRVKGAQDVKFASFQVTAGTASDVRISAISFDENGNDNIMSEDFDDLEVWSDVDNDGAYVKNGEKLALTSTNASESEQISLTTYIVVPAGKTIPIELKGDVLSGAANATAIIDIEASGITATAVSTGNTISSVPTNLVSGQTVTIAASGTFTLALDSASNLRDNQVTAGTTGISLGAWKLVASDSENIRITAISFVNAGNNVNGLQNFKLYDEDNKLLATMAGSLATDGFVTFDLTASPFIIDVVTDRSEVLTLKGDTVYTATSAQTAQFALGKIKASGATSVKDIYPTNTTETTTQVVATVNAYAVGDVLAIHDDSGASTDQDNTVLVITATAAGASLATAVGGGLTLANTDTVTKIDAISTEAPSTAATYNYRVGDVVALYDTSTVANDGLYVVKTAVNAGATLLGANVPIMNLTLATGDRITKIASGLSEAVSTSSTIVYAKGDVIVWTDDDALASDVYLVNADVPIGTDITVANALIKGYTFAAPDRIAKLPILSTETVSTSSTYTYSVGDVIAVHDDSATTDDGIFVVETAKAAGSDLTAAAALATGLTLTTSDIITKVAAKTAKAPERLLYGTVLGFAWDTSFTAATSAGSQKDIAKFKLSSTANQSNADVVVTAINLTEGGSATLTNLTLRNETLTLNVATNETDTNLTGLSGNGVLIPAGTTYTYTVKADIGTNANNETTDLTFASGSIITGGSVTWKTQISGADVTTGITWIDHEPATDTKAGASISSASDTTAPTVSSVAISGGTNDTAYDTEAMLITFSEKIDPSTISSSLTYGGSISVVNNASTCGLSLTDNGATDTLNVKDIVNLGVGAAAGASGSTITVTCALNAAGTALTITGTSGGLTGNAELTHAASNPLATTVDDAAGNKLATTAVTASGTW